ncbi:acetyl-CoA carboxylase biotin carboxyl carrier protein subunit, partial [Pseudoflavonifractor phocaeensis]|nr:acetyl-CoA carboxylase biotin carboxyl carrier protein subunit [Pseudoflavonifractor phocaeensis]
MNYNVTVNGKVYSVTVEKTGAAAPAAAAPVMAAPVAAPVAAPA